YTAAMIGADALVPPTSSQVPPVPKVSYTATPVLGSATAETSLLARRAHWVATPACQDGLASTAEQPEPVPLQTVSAQPRVAAVPRAAPGGRGPAGGGGRLGRRGAAARGDDRGGGGVLHAEAAVPGRGGHRHARVVEELTVEGRVRQ